MRHVWRTETDGAEMKTKVTKKKTPGFKETARIMEYRGLQDQYDVLQDQMDAITGRLDKLWYGMTENELVYLDSK